MQENGEISGVAGVDIGDKRSYARVVGLGGQQEAATRSRKFLGTLVPEGHCAAGRFL